MTYRPKDLLPCPFCGALPEVVGDDEYAVIRCVESSCPVWPAARQESAYHQVEDLFSYNPIRFCDNANAAAAKWNRRADAPCRTGWVDKALSFLRRKPSK